MSEFYKEYSELLAEVFGPGKVQKLSVDLALGCPNRDGTIGRGGCAYCNNAAFSPDAAKQGLSVTDQLERGRSFFARKYPSMRYLAYFQSYTSTYAARQLLLSAYDEALRDNTVGMVIGTRPDCMPSSLLDDLAALSQQYGKPVMIEFGIETFHNSTLKAVNRGHTSEQACDAVRRTAAAGFHVGAHLIMGLPGEDEAMMAQTLDCLSSLPVTSVKLHQLQILEGTLLAARYRAGELDFMQFTPQSYAELCARLLRHIRPDIAIDRFIAQAPPHMLIAPKWGLKNYQFTAILHRCLKESAQNLPYPSGSK